MPIPNADLGKYAVYVWPPYVISLAVIAWLAADSLLRSRRWKREVERREALKARRRDQARAS